MDLKKSKHYIHASLSNNYGDFEPKPMLIVGGSSSGKSILGEKIVEQISDNKNNCISIYFVDVNDVIESGYCMFPATDKRHVEFLNYQRELPEASKNVKLHLIYGKRLKDWQRRTKNLPNFDVITFSAKKILQREEAMFLLETEKENKSVRLMISVSEMLKKTDDARYIRFYAKKLTQKKKTMYKGVEIETDDEPIGDKSDIKDIEGALQLFEQDGMVMADDYELNFDARKILNQPNSRHVFVYKAVKQDRKLREFLVFHIFNEIARALPECKFPVNLMIEEIGSLAPVKPNGHKAVFANHVGKQIGELRKSAKGGVTILMLGTVWSQIAEQIRSQCKKQMIFHLEQDDMLKYVKARSLTGKAKTNIENLKTGEFIIRGHEITTLKAKVPKHSHKHVGMDFLEEYRKHYPKMVRKYTDLIKQVEEEHKKQQKGYDLIIKEELEKKKKMIDRKLRAKAKTAKEKEQVQELQDQMKEKKEEERAKINQAIIDEYNDLVMHNEKVSFRKIAKDVTDKGFKVSHVTVKKVLDEHLHTKGEQKETVNE